MGSLLLQVGSEVDLLAAQALLVQLAQQVQRRSALERQQVEQVELSLAGLQRVYPRFAHIG